MERLGKDETFDVCVIGSGAAGGVMAKELCEGGAKVVMLEAGRAVPLSELLSHKWPYELPYRGFRGEKQAPFYQGPAYTRTWNTSATLTSPPFHHVLIPNIRNE
jgi:choline dehydrogenase-like flavoprotein